LDEITALRFLRLSTWVIGAAWLLPRVGNQLRAIVLLYLFNASMLLWMGATSSMAVVCLLIADVLVIKILIDVADGKLGYKGRSVAQQIEKAKYLARGKLEEIKAQVA
jgi:hypothetical protein